MEKTIAAGDDMNRIASFQGEWRFLSNFWLCPVNIENVFYSSVEHAYQAMKTINPVERQKIYLATSPAEAKQLGKMVTIRPGWNDNLKIEYMDYLIWDKFSNSPELGNKLLSTGDMELIEGNTWGDKFWGVCDGIGHNHLGKILMKVRSQIKRIGPCQGDRTIPLERTEPIDKKFKLGSSQVFVFGSNLSGVHGAGAARYAKQYLEAVDGTGIGPMPSIQDPSCYAIPTKDERIQTLPLDRIRQYVWEFIMFAWERTDLRFFVTRIGCGLAGYTDEEIGPMFEDAPPNCELPYGWGPKDA